MTAKDKELMELNRRAREHLIALVVSGVDPRAANVATMVACIERMVSTAGRAATAAYVRRLADAIELGTFEFDQGQGH